MGVFSRLSRCIRGWLLWFRFRAVLMIAVYNQEKSPRSMKGVWGMKLGWGSRAGKSFFAAPTTFVGGFGGLSPGGRGQDIRFGRIYTHVHISANVHSVYAYRT